MGAHFADDIDFMIFAMPAAVHGASPATWAFAEVLRMHAWRTFTPLKNLVCLCGLQRLDN
jgi:hypothetical protein